MNEDAELLNRYATADSETAFTELVRRQVNMVYSAALRLLDGDVHRAEDVTQQVFAELARKARRLTKHPALAGWLYTTTRQMARRVTRSEFRRKVREQEATTMNELLRETDSEVDWARLRPALDDAMHELGETDRFALLLRFFQGRTLKDVGTSLNLNENAARMRVERALEKLRVRLARKGLTSTSSALAAVLAANTITAAPAAFVSTLAGMSLAGGAAGTGTTLNLLKIMTATKLQAGLVSAVVIAGVLVALLWRREEKETASQDNPSAPPAVREATDSIFDRRSASLRAAALSRRETNAAPAATPEEIVAGRLTQYGRSRRDFANALAQRYGVEVPDAVKLFFDAVEAGNWDDIDARFKVLAGTEPNASVSAPGRPPGLEHLWPAIVDAYGAAEQTHLWPAQQFLDYGNAILDSLRPGMVYVGGTDNGRWIPEMLNDTSDGERHAVITQNGLADATYLDYLSVRYGDRLNLLTEEDSRNAFQEYVADAQERLQHDQEFPDEPKQVRPGEDIKIKDGLVQVSGQAAVMAINERILQALMEKNPNLSFAVQESYPMRSTYADALPLGPLMELRADGQNAFTPERATQSLEYWQATSQQLLSDPLASGSSGTLLAYSHDVNAAAHLLAAHNYSAEAEQAYRLASQLVPWNPEPAVGLSELLVRAGRSDEARQVLDDFSQKYPDVKFGPGTASITFLWTAPAH